MWRCYVLGNQSISVSNGIYYEKVDADNWLLIPKHNQVPVTTFLDVKELTIDNNSLNVDKSYRPTIEQMLKEL